MKNNKKGFTLLEMVVVVAISIIIFTTCMITFVNLTKKARLNADATFVKTINELIEDSSESVESIDDALEVISKNGYSNYSFLAKLPTDHIVYDEENKFFYMVNDNGKVVYCQKTPCKEKSTILVIDKEDLCIEGNLYFYKDIETTENIEISSNYSIDLNDKTLKSNGVIAFYSEEGKEVLIDKGSINAKTIKFSTHNTIINLGNDLKINTTEFISNSNIKLNGKVELNIEKTIKLNDNVEFYVSGEHKLTIPANIKLGNNVKVSPNLTSIPSKVNDINDFVLTISSDDSFYIKSVNDLILEGDCYVLQSGYYCLRNDLMLDKPLKIGSKDNTEVNVTLNLNYYSINGNADKCIINYGVLTVYGKALSQKTSTIYGGRYGIYNYNTLTINTVNILTGNGEGEDKYYTYNGDFTYGIYCLASASNVTINGSKIQSAVGVFSKKGKLIINSAEIVSKKYTVEGAGTIEIGTQKDSVIDFNTVCYFYKTERNIVIGKKSFKNENIKINEIIDAGNGENLLDYTK